MALEAGNTYQETFSFTQEEVAAFAKVTGDTNPVHLDEAYAATTAFKKPIMHGMLGAGVISRVMGTKFPGEGSIYLGQDLQFKRPMYAGVEYVVIATVKETDPAKHTALIETVIQDKATGKLCTSGTAQIMNKEKI